MFLFRTKSILIFGITLQTYSVGFHLYKIIEFLEIQVYHLIHIFIFMYTNKYLTLLLLLPSTCWQYESAETCQKQRCIKTCIMEIHQTIHQTNIITNLFNHIFQVLPL